MFRTAPFSVGYSGEGEGVSRSHCFFQLILLRGACFPVSFPIMSRVADPSMCGARGLGRTQVGFVFTLPGAMVCYSHGCTVIKLPGTELLLTGKEESADSGAEKGSLVTAGPQGRFCIPSRQCLR